MQPNIQAVVTDLDGVIRFFPPNRDLGIEQKFQLPSGAIGAIAFSPRLLLPAIKGIVPDELWRERIALELKAKFPRIDCTSAVKEWSNFPGEVAPDTLWFLRSLCSTIPLILLTNATSRLEEDLRKLDILRTFDRVMSSSLMGSVKPEAAAFNRVIKTLSLDPEAILFIDDAAENVAAAKGCGMQAIEYSSLPDLKQQLSAFRF